MSVLGISLSVSRKALPIERENKLNFHLLVSNEVTCATWGTASVLPSLFYTRTGMQIFNLPTILLSSLLLWLPFDETETK